MFKTVGQIGRGIHKVSSEPWAENQVWQHTLGRLRQPERDETTSRRKEKGKSRKGIEKEKDCIKRSNI